MLDLEENSRNLEMLLEKINKLEETANLDSLSKE